MIPFLKLKVMCSALVATRLKALFIVNMKLCIDGAEISRGKFEKHVIASTKQNIWKTY